VGGQTAMIPTTQPAIPDYIYARNQRNGDHIGFRFLAIHSQVGSCKPRPETRGYVFVKEGEVEHRFTDCNTLIGNVLEAKVFFLNGKPTYSMLWLDREFRG